VAACLAGAALVALAPDPIVGLGSVEDPTAIEGLGTIGGVRAYYLVQAALGALALATASSMFRRLLGARVKSVNSSSGSRTLPQCSPVVSS
jgi:hypothetical protein